MPVLAERRYVALVGATLLLVAGCVSSAPRSDDTPLVWPAPPDEPRIRWITSYSKRGHFGAEGGTERLKAALLGENGMSLERMAKPYGVTTDSEGRVYVSDTGLGSVWIFDPVKRQVRSIGTSGSVTLATPSGLAIDDRGRLWVADARLNRIVAFDAGGTVVMTIGQKDEFRAAGGVAFDPAGKRLYIADARRHAIRVYDTASGTFLFEFGRRGSAPAELNFPTHLFIRHGRLYVSDTMNFRVQVFDLEGRHLASIGAMGANLGQFARPKGVAVDAAGHVYVADAAFNNFQIFDPAGALLLFVGRVGTNRGEFWLPAGLHIDGNDRLYVVDQYNRRVQVFQFVGVPAK
jgi:DNA-binding beta-propeller fold protein YncE